MGEVTSNYLYGLVDMGSNGIRFSITDLVPATSRSLPVVFQERLGISLYDAQYSSGSKGPIPQDVIDEVVVGMSRFKLVCADFGVAEEKIKVLATEATRNAINSEDFRKQIKTATGWGVGMLPKEEEGRIGAMGIASSFENVEGLVMDLGGGSTQLTWMIYQNGQVQTAAKGSVSFPYGAAAMTQLLSKIDEDKNSSQGRADLKSKIEKQYIEAIESLELPASLKAKSKSHGLTLYLSGGGFRGWGYILMAKAKKGPYPVPIINGFHASVKDFGSVDVVKEKVEDDDDIFRVSKRRAKQVPAVAFLIDAITTALPFIVDVRFCQGGVREGFLFDSLSPETKNLSPLSSATSRYATDKDSAAHIAALLASALPTDGTSIDRSYPTSFSPSLFRAVADTMYVQSNAPKESASLSALYLPITGVLSAAHGVSHIDRALLAFALCQRWDGELPPPHDEFQTRLQSLLTNQEVWWAKYLGVVAALIGDVYPSGKVPDATSSTSPHRIELESRWATNLGKKGNMHGVVLSAKILKGGVVGKTLVDDHVEDIEDMGKKKNRVGGKDYGFGLPVEVDVQWI